MPSQQYGKQYDQTDNTKICYDAGCTMYNSEINKTQNPFSHCFRLFDRGERTVQLMQPTDSRFVTFCELSPSSTTGDQNTAASVHVASTRYSSKGEPDKNCLRRHESFWVFFSRDEDDDGFSAARVSIRYRNSRPTRNRILTIEKY